MPAKAATPYLFFSGRANEAIKHYERALGAKATGVMPFQDDPSRVMHAVLAIGQVKLMLSDVPAHMKASEGGNVEICLDFDDLDEMQKQFELLAQGAKKTSPIKKEFWGAHFGGMTDAYNIQWMFNCEAKS